jgi:hypothetical protein
MQPSGHTRFYTTLTDATVPGSQSRRDPITLPSKRLLRTDAVAGTLFAEVRSRKIACLGEWSAVGAQRRYRSRHNVSLPVEESDE